MKTMKNWLLTGLMFLMVSTAFAQGKVSGTVTDGKGSLPGANIVIKGTKIAVSTDFDGKFSINTTANSGELVISFIGYKSKTVKFNGAANVGTVALVADDNQLQEIVVRSSVVDVAKDRKTPVAVSTIKAAEIQEKLGSQEFPEILANTPSVYATKSGGGFGDSRINIRGFDQRNIAVLINGVPVNDMENSAVYWSNWAGLSDVTSAMQVQRGLGSSKLAISSVGGTINIVTRSADMKEGGSVSVGVANDNYLKKAFSYSTGVMKNGLSTSILLSQTNGDGYIDGTKFEAGNYFIGIGYKINPKHDVEFTITGAPQWHNQRSAAPTIAQFIKYGSNGEPNRRYNNDWGILNGQEYNFRTNFYHKPIASVNWDYKINDKTKLSTVVYGSWGRGGGSNGAGAMRGNRFFSDNLRLPNGIINVDLINAWNSGKSVVIPGSTGTSTRTLVGGAYQNSSSTSNNTTNGITKIASINSHNWYGGVVNLNTKLSERFTLDFGVDARTYRGIHYQNMVDLLGSTNYADNNDKNNPNRVLTGTYAARPNLNPLYSLGYQTDKINYNNDGLVNWYGAFTQLEYSADKLTAFFQGSVSNQGFRRDDYFLYLTPNPLSSTDYKNLLGGNVKGGANYNINDNHNVFVNAGYYSKQPFFNAVYPNNQSLVNENLTNEKVLGLEAGYGFRSAVFNANVNVYHTTWKDRYQRSSDNAVDNPGGYYDFAGITQVHSGVELDMNAKVGDKLKLNGMFSLGKWVYEGNITGRRFDVNNNNISGGTTTTYFVDGTRVGDVAQMTASLGAAYELAPRFNVDANYRLSDKLFASLDPTRQTSATNKGTLELPSYGLVDAGISYRLLLGTDKSKSLNFRLNINNVLDEVYIAESRSNIFATDFVSGTSGPTYNSAGRTYNGVADANQVFFGFGRTWNFTMRYNF
ncbi:TonB-dependent receptor [Flavobacterium sp.]|uniref:TonB-dependent receptor n=1 Tax=Flavobacterium sp. TaxID=239 RepID=UPI0008D66E7E|nr:TonB-dependent receptor [Flavobacterium sp.]OGS65468.1 MAG: TonB-dependent receptor [Flavobacteria bacterium GWA2_35_26]HCF03639.1 TonB-dependent receptor [Flavobacterium sp.]